MIALVCLTLVFLLLLLLAVVPDRSSSRVRVFAIFLAPAAAVFVWAAVHAYEGWPVPVAKPPVGAVFVAGVVDEPRAIYLWLTPRGEARPRAYRLPYSDALYLQVIRAQRELRHGHPSRVGSSTLRAGSGQKVPPFLLHRYNLPNPSPPHK